MLQDKVTPMGQGKDKSKQGTLPYFSLSRTYVAAPKEQNLTLSPQSSPCSAVTKEELKGYPTAKGQLRNKQEESSSK